MTRRWVLRLVAAVATVAMLAESVSAYAHVAQAAHEQAGATGARPRLAPIGDEVTFGDGGLQSLVPTRLLDTRSGLGAPVGAVGPQSTTVLQVGGRGGVPASGAGAVVLNVTATDPTAAGYITVFPTGAPLPLASSLNMVAGQTVPNLVVVKLGAGGQVSLYNSAGTSHLIADVAGWFPEGDGIEPVVPTRVLDTREGVGASRGKVAAGSTTHLVVAGHGGLPSTGVAGVVLNVTVTEPTAAGYVTVFPSGDPQPLASNLNMVPGQTVPNLVVAKVGADGAVDIFNSAGESHLVADVTGWFSESSPFHPLAPARLLDTRDGTGAPAGAVGAQSDVVLQVTGRGGVPSASVGAVVLNVTATEPTGAGYLTIYPSDVERPTASNLNFTPGTTVPNLVIAKVAADGTVKIFNSAGSTQIIADVAGWFPDGSAGLTTFQLLEGTVLAGSEDVMSVGGDSSVGGSVTLNSATDIPRAGGHLVVAPGAATADGIAGTVVSVTANPDGTTTVVLEPAALEAMFADLEVDSTLPTTNYDSSTAEDEPQHATDRQQLGVSCTFGGTVIARPRLSMNLGGDVKFSLHNRFARVAISGTATAALDIGIRFAGSCSVDLPTIRVPVSFVVTEFKTKATVTISAALTASITATSSLQVGFQYDHGDVSNLSYAQSNGGAVVQPTAKVAASLNITVSATPKLLGVIGAGISLGPKVELSADSNGCVKVNFSLDVSIKADIGKWMFDWKFDLGRVSLVQITLYQSAECTDPNTTVPPTNPPGTFPDDLVYYSARADCAGFGLPELGPGQHFIMTAQSFGTSDYNYEFHPSPTFWTDDDQFNLFFPDNNPDGLTLLFTYVVNAGGQSPARSGTIKVIKGQAPPGYISPDPHANIGCA
jgi:hypothetical protein